MGWVNSSYLFYSTSETVTNIANVAFPGIYIPTKPYTPTNSLYHTSPEATSGPSQLQYTDVYMDSIKCLTQPPLPCTQHHRLTELVLSALNEIYLTILWELKDSMSLKKVVLGDGDWAVIKEILG